MKPGYYIDFWNDIAIRYPDGRWEVMTLKNEWLSKEDTQSTRDHQALQMGWEFLGAL